MKVGSVFSGIGGFDLGLEQAGHEIVWQVENNAACNEVLAEHWPDVRRYGDVQTVRGVGLEPVDLICGGFPCQDLSVAGNRAGLAGERSGLWHEFRRLLQESRPAWCVIENVPGVLSSDGGRDMGTILGGLGQLGYGWAYRCLDAQWFGLAQRRNRVFVVGHLGDGASPATVLFEPEGGGWDIASRREAGKGIAGTLPGGAPGGSSHGKRSGDDRMTMVPDLAYCLPAHHQCDQHEGTYVPQLAESVSASYAADGQVQEEISYSLDSTQGQAIVFDETQVTSSGNYSNPRAGQPSHPLAAGARPPSLANYSTVRRLTPKECERLQGFPDDWTASLSDSARYRCLGNAVAVPVARWIGERLLAYLALEVPHP